MFLLHTEGFEIEPWQVVSEYGMCELASQAYDWVSPESKNETRRFRFPWWVSVSQSISDESTEKTGFGALCVHDRARIDIPSTIRTQDLVSLSKDQSFTLLGRVPAAALKGCSLKTEEIMGEGKVVAATHSSKTVAVDLREASKRLMDALGHLQSFLEDEDFIALTQREFENTYVAKGFIEDLTAGMEHAKRFPEEALTKAIQAQTTTFSNWLFILSATHPQAAFYPLLFAYALGVNLWVRATSQLDCIESRFIQFLNQQRDAKVNVLPPTFRIGNEAMPNEIDAIFCFGSNETVELIAQESALPTTGFGSHLTVSILTEAKPLSIQEIVKDCLSLGQKGCMSTRLIINVCSYSQKAAEKLFDQLTSASIPWANENQTRSVALSHELTEARIKKGVNAGTAAGCRAEPCMIDNH